MNFKVLLLALVCVIGIVLPASADVIPWIETSGCWTYTGATTNYVMFNNTLVNDSYTIPPAITSIKVHVLGGGGGGGGQYYAGGGGAGQYLNATMTVIPGQVMLYKVGANGTQAISGNGFNGSFSQFAQLWANGGQGGYAGLGTVEQGDALGGHAWRPSYGEGGHGAANSGSGGGGGGGYINGTSGDGTPNGGGGGIYITQKIDTYTLYLAQGGSGGAFGPGVATSTPGLVGGTGANATAAATRGQMDTGSGGGGGAHSASYPRGAPGGNGIIILEYSNIPSETFVANVTQFVTPQTVLFNASSSTFPGIGFNWYWGDGTTSTTVNPTTTHTFYGNSTTYDVMLVTSYSGYNDSVTTNTAMIKALPKIASWNQITGSLGTEHAFQPITLVSTSNFTSQVGPSSNIWTWNNGSGILLQQTGDTTYWNITYPDTYTVSLNTTNQFGTNITTISPYITIVDIPTPTSFITSNIQYFTNYQGKSVTFNDTGEDQHVMSWLWDWGDGLKYYTTASTAKNSTHVYNATGTYTVSLAKTNALGTYTNSTPTDYINIQIPTLSVTNSPSYANRNLTGMFTFAATNISRADDISWFTMYNFTTINITSVSLNSSAPLTATMNAGWSSPGTLNVNVTSPDMTQALTSNYVDIKYLVKDSTNVTGPSLQPWTPINLNGGGSGTQYVIGNKTLYGATTGGQVPTYTNGSVLITNSTFTKLIKFYNNVNNQKISGQTLTVQWIPSIAAGSFATTNNGEYSLSSTYDPAVSVTGQATGYYNGTVTYVWGDNDPESQFLTPLSGASGSTVWYTPKQVRFRVMDGYNNPLPYTTVDADFVASTLPSSDPSWLQTAYGISRSVAEDMMNGGLAMTGITGADGYITFTMHGSLQYNMSVTNTTSGISGWYQKLYPMDNEYLLRVSTSQANREIATNSYVYTQNTTLWAQELTGDTIRLGLNFTDTSGQSTNVKFYVWDAINGTVYNTNTSAAPGIATYQTYFDLPNIRGNKYLWNYTAVRT